MTLWVANYGAAADTRWTQITGKEIASATYVQWTPGSAEAGRSGTAPVVAKNASSISMSYPSNSITRVAVTLK